MKKLNLTAAAAVAAVVMSTSFVAPGVAQAEMSTTVGVSSMYLWRGQNLTPDGGQVSGSVDYKNKNGMYAGAWTGSEFGGHETDLYVGYGGEAAGFSYGVSYWKYLYPENTTSGGSKKLGDNDASEVVLTAGYGPIAIAAYVGVESGATDDNYYTISGSFDKFTVLYGFWSKETAGANEYSHIQLSYKLTDEISASISKATNDSADTASDAVEEDPLFQIGYTKTFDLK